MVMKTLDVNAVYQLVPEVDKDAETKTVIYYRQMDKRLKAYIMRRIREGKGSPDEIFAVAVELFSVTVDRIDNFLDAGGNLIPLDTAEKIVAGKPRKVIADAVMDRIDDRVIMEVFDAVFEKSGMREKEQKN